MTVSELIDLLQDLDPNARVLIMSQQSWPFENAVVGVTVREEVMRADADEEGDEEDLCIEYDEGTAATDVFIVEGRQLRYGSKAAWDCV
jgi:hypothetical protein